MKSSSTLWLQDGESWDVVLLGILVFAILFFAQAFWKYSWVAGVALCGVAVVALCCLLPRIGRSGTTLSLARNTLCIDRKLHFGLRDETLSVPLSTIKGTAQISTWWTGPDYRTKLVIQISKGDPVTVGRFDTWDHGKSARAERNVCALLKSSSQSTTSDTT